MADTCTPALPRRSLKNCSPLVCRAQSCTDEAFAALVREFFSEFRGLASQWHTQDTAYRCRAIRALADGNESRGVGASAGRELLRCEVVASATADLASSQSSAYDLSALKALDRPLRPIFVSPASALSHNPASSFTTFIPIVCTSASKLATETDGMERARGFTYVQGSGDE